MIIDKSLNGSSSLWRILRLPRGSDKSCQVSLPKVPDRRLYSDGWIARKQNLMPLFMCFLAKFLSGYPASKNLIILFV